jgi:2-polyprenyl-3-methyl-5-hydroxy-6-metoxy-1,4-benzoquinol methylase
MGLRRPMLDSTCQWDRDSQRGFWTHWDMRYLQEDALGQQARRRGQVVFSLVRSLRLQRPRILEIGCGNGWLAEELQMFGPVPGVRGKV